MFSKLSHAFTPRPATTSARQIGVWGILAFAMLFAIQASAAQISLAWGASSSASATGYKLYFGKASGNYTTSSDVGNRLDYTVGGLTSGQNYYFAVKAYDAAGVQSAFSNEAAGTAPAATVADFSASPTSGTAPLTATFVNKSAGATSYSWNFGDSGSTSNTSTAANPTHTYNNAGAYTVTLNATGADGTKTKTLTSYINVSAPVATTNKAPTPTISSPSANVTVAQGSTVSFEGTGTDPDNNTPLTYSWNFGNASTPSTSTAQNQTVTFATAGTYTVSLTVKDSKGLAATTPATRVVTVTAPTSTTPVANADRYTVQSGTTLSVAAPGVLSNDTSPSGKSLTAKGVTNVASGTGTLIFYSSGKFTFKPASGFVGTTSFTYAATDGTTTSSPATVTITVTAAATTSTTSGLVAAYAFNEGSGTTVADSSGKGNAGTIANATWTTSGRFGKALSFNGRNAWVTVNDSPTLDLTTGMTLEAWVKPSNVPNAWMDVIYKGMDNYFLEASSPYNSVPLAGVISSDFYVEAFGSAPLSANTWRHLAATYDGAAMKFYVDGMLISSANKNGTIRISTAPLQIGGDRDFGAYFSGLIDEIRIYSRALSAAEIQSDMVTPVK